MIAVMLAVVATITLSLAVQRESHAVALARNLFRLQHLMILLKEFLMALLAAAVLILLSVLVLTGISFFAVLQVRLVAAGAKALTESFPVSVRAFVG